MNDATGVLRTTQRFNAVADKTVSIPKKADVIRMVLGDQRAGRAASTLKPPEMIGLAQNVMQQVSRLRDLRSFGD